MKNKLTLKPNKRISNKLLAFIIAAVLIPSMVTAGVVLSPFFQYRANALTFSPLPTWSEFSYSKKNVINMGDLVKQSGTNWVNISNYNPTFSSANGTVTVDDGGSLDKDDIIILISNPEEMRLFTYYAGGRTELTTDVTSPNAAPDFFLSASYMLGANIDYSSYSFSSVPVGTALSKPFSGFFDGQGFEITGLKISEDQFSDYGGLFAYNGGIVKNLGLISPNYTNGLSAAVGLLIGKNLSAAIVQNCFVQTPTVNSANSSLHVAGLVYSNSGTVSNNYFAGNLNAFENRYPVLRENDLTITQCYYDSDVFGAATPLTGVTVQTTTELQAMSGILTASDDFGTVWYKHSGNYPKLYGLREAYSVPIRNVNYTNTNTGTTNPALLLVRPADIIYLPKAIDVLAGGSGRFFVLNNCIDMSTVSEYAYQMTTTLFQGTLVSRVQTVNDPCTAVHSAISSEYGSAAESHSILNFRINNAVISGTNQFTGMFYFGSGASVLNINFIGGYMKTPLSTLAVNVNYNYYGGLLGYCSSGTTNFNNIHSSADALTEESALVFNEVTQTDETVYTQLGGNFYLGGLFSYAYSTGTFSNISVSGTVKGGIHTNYRDSGTFYARTGGIAGVFRGSTSSVISTVKFSGRVEGTTVFKTLHSTVGTSSGSYVGGIFAEIYNAAINLGDVENTGEIYSASKDPIPLTQQITDTMPINNAVRIGGIFGYSSNRLTKSSTAALFLQNSGTVYAVEYLGKYKTTEADINLTQTIYIGGIGGYFGTTSAITDLEKFGKISIYNPSATEVSYSLWAGGLFGVSNNGSNYQEMTLSYSESSPNQNIISIESYNAGTSYVFGVSYRGNFTGIVSSVRIDTTFYKATGTVGVYGMSGCTDNRYSTLTDCESNAILNIIFTADADPSTVYIAGLGHFATSMQDSVSNFTLNAVFDYETIKGFNFRIAGCVYSVREVNNVRNYTDFTEAQISFPVQTNRAGNIYLGGIAAEFYQYNIGSVYYFQNAANYGDINFDLSSASVNATFQIGGIVASYGGSTTLTQQTAGILKDCINFGAITLRLPDTFDNGIYLGGVANYIRYQAVSLVNLGNITVYAKNAGTSTIASRRVRIGGVISNVDGNIDVLLSDLQNAGSINVYAVGTGYNYAAGIAAVLERSTIMESCINMGTVSDIAYLSSGGRTILGGIIGRIDGNSSRSYTINGMVNHGEIDINSASVAAGIIADTTVPLSSTLKNAMNYGLVKNSSNSAGICGSVSYPSGGGFIEITGILYVKQSESSSLSFLSNPAASGSFTHIYSTSTADSNSAASFLSLTANKTEDFGTNGIYNVNFYFRTSAYEDNISNNLHTAKLLFTDYANPLWGKQYLDNPISNTLYSMYALVSSQGREGGYYYIDGFTDQFDSDFTRGNYRQLLYSRDTEITDIALTSVNGYRSFILSEGFLDRENREILFIVNKDTFAEIGSSTLFGNGGYTVDILTRSANSTATYSSPLFILNFDAELMTAQEETGIITISQTGSGASSDWTIKVLYVPTSQNLDLTSLTINGGTTSLLGTGVSEVISTESTKQRLQYTVTVPDNYITWDAGRLRLEFDTLNYLLNDSFLSGLTLRNSSDELVTTFFSRAAGSGINYNVTTQEIGGFQITFGDMYLDYSFDTTFLSGTYTLRLETVNQIFYFIFTRELCNEARLYTSGITTGTGYIRLETSTVAISVTQFTTLASSRTLTLPYPYELLPYFSLLQSSGSMLSIMTGTVTSPSADITNPTITYGKYGTNLNQFTFEFYMRSEVEKAADPSDISWKTNADKKYTIILNENAPIIAITTVLKDNVGQPNFSSLTLAKNEGAAFDVTYADNTTISIDRLGLRVMKDDEFTVILGSEGMPYFTAESDPNTKTKLKISFNVETYGGKYTFDKYFAYFEKEYPVNLQVPINNSLIGTFNWQEFSMNPLTIEKIASKDSYTKNIQFSFSPTAGTILYRIAEEDARVNGGTYNVATGDITYFENVANPASSLRARYIDIDLNYSTEDENPFFSEVLFTLPDRYAKMQWLEVNPVTGEEIGWKDIYYYINPYMVEDNTVFSDFQVQSEYTAYEYRIIAENQSYITYYNVTLGGAKQNKRISLELVFETGADTIPYLAAYFKTYLKIQDESELGYHRKVTRASTINYIGASGIYSKKYLLINHIAAQYLIEMMLPKGYSARVELRTGEDWFEPNESESDLLWFSPSDSSKLILDLDTEGAQVADVRITVFKSSTEIPWGHYVEDVK